MSLERELHRRGRIEGRLLFDRWRPGLLLLGQDRRWFRAGARCCRLHGPCLGLSFRLCTFGKKAHQIIIGEAASTLDFATYERIAAAYGRGKGALMWADLRRAAAEGEAVSKRE